MKINYFPIAIIRTPAFSLNSNLSEAWEELKEKIQESSPNFHEIIKDKNFQELKDLPEKTRFTIWKYFNRAKYRATPFGSFAAISLVPIHRDAIPIVINQKMIKHHFIDWGEKEAFIPKKISIRTILLTNSSLYKLGDELRYLRFVNGHFELATVSLFPELEFLLNRCKNKTTLKEIYSAMLESFNLSATSTRNLIKQLISLQLFITDNDPNITGTDYFKRIGTPAPQKPTDYIIAERDVSVGKLSQEPLKAIPNMISFLHKNLPAVENNNLNHFKTTFKKKFENRTISLAIAMDPEVGIGYGNLEQPKEENGLVTILKNENKKKKFDINFMYTKFHSFLLSKMSDGNTIQLEEFKAEHDETAGKIANTFSVMFHFFKGNPVISSAGGATATSLLGRFTLASEQLNSHCREITKVEEKANPRVVFFDIAYQVENHIDNVNRRKTIYANELPILTYPEGDEMLNFEDILVSILGDEIVLSSKKTGDRLVPRIPSAYNYTRSDLAAYRFLCDLQNQHLIINLSFTLTRFFGGLAFYPRTCYQNIILSPATWLLPKYFYEKNGALIEDKLIALKNWLKQNKIDFLFKTGIADHTLCFSPKVNSDLECFLFYCNQYNGSSLYIMEALLIDEDGISDELKQVYASQYIVNYFHDNKVYSSFNMDRSTRTPPTKTDIKLPGEDWLYFDIFTHPSRSNSILLQEIKQHLRKSSKSFDKWFFIRYTDPSPHLRLRLKLKNETYGFTIIHSLTNLIKPLLLNGLVTDFAIKTYYRETQRYGSERIDMVEYFFYQDSRYILSILTKAKDTNQLYASALQLFTKYVSLSFATFNDRISFVNLVATNFAKEMNMAADHFRKINAAYNEFRKDLNKLSISVPKSLSIAHEHAFLKIINNCIDQKERQKILADLIHMHVNRLFISDQRMHETIIYHYLLRMLQTQKALLSD